MSSINHIVIVGAGIAGARAAESLRKEGYEGAITLLGNEPERPYKRPPLSKEYLHGEGDRAQAYVHPEGFYTDNRIDLRTSSTVRAIEPASREVILDNGDRLPFDRLLITTGARPRTLEVPGADLPGVRSLRTLADADAIRAAALEAERIVVIGAGWIGNEVAASLRALDRPVTIVSLAPSRWSGSSAARSAESSVTCTPITGWTCGPARPLPGSSGRIASGRSRRRPATGSPRTW